MEKNISEILKTSGALLEGHFVLTSGLHSKHYIEKFRIMENPKLTDELCRTIADNFKNEKVTTVIGPMTGGIILAHIVAKYLGVKGIFTERINGKMILRRGFSLNQNNNILIVEDIITTGSSVTEVIEIVLKSGAKIAGISCLVDRSGNKFADRLINDYNISNYKPLFKLEIETFVPEICPLCKQGLDITKPGSTNKSF